LKQYSIIITTSALLANLIVLAYFFYDKEPDSNHFIRSSTEFSQNAVPGPIQPIPEIVSIDLEWVRLGKALFNSTLLSKDNSISCASCHLLNFGGADSFPVSVGVGDLTGNRNSPTVINAVFNFRQFWDGRSRNLSEQVAGPIHNPLEMASGWPQII
jgi:cytochrome c peroxidase